MTPEQQQLLRANAQANFNQEQQGSWLSRFGAELGKSPQQALSDNLMRGQMDNFGGQLQSQMVGNGQANQAQGYNALGIQDVAPPAVVGGIAPPMTSPNIPATSGARKVMHKEQQNDQKTQEKAQSDYEKRVRDYMSKREGIALDTQNRMAKLDSIYTNQGTDLSPLARLMDQNSGVYSDASGRMGEVNPPTNFEKQYSQGRMSEQDLIGLKNKLAMQQDKQYGSMTDDSANMLRMEMMKEQYDASNKLREKLGMTKANKQTGVKVSGETKNKIGLINSATSGIDDMFTLLSTGTGDASLTDPFLASKYTIAKQTILDNFAHLQTGAAISAEESKLYKSLIPQYRDSKDIKMHKLRKMRDILQGRHHMYTTGDLSMPVDPSGQVVSNTATQDPWTTEMQKRGLL